MSTEIQRYDNGSLSEQMEFSKVIFEVSHCAPKVHVVFANLLHVCVNILIKLMRNFDWSLAKPEKPWRETNYMGIFIHDQMWVLVSERTANAWP